MRLFSNYLQVANEIHDILLHLCHMTPNQMVIFDLDDTLLNTSHLYFKCRRDFIELLSGYASCEELTKRFEEKDEVHIDQFGYAPWRYAYTMVEVYSDLVEEGRVSFRPTELRHIVDIGEKIQTSVPDLREGALETLSRISEHHTISLLTRGNENLQHMKVQKHNLDEYFVM